MISTLGQYDYFPMVMFLFGLNPHSYPYFAYATNEGSGEFEDLCRLGLPEPSLMYNEISIKILYAVSNICHSPM